MVYSSLRQLLVFVCMAVMFLGPTPGLVLSQTSTVTGRIAGRVYDKEAKMPLAGVAVNALLITANKRYGSETNALGSYVIPNVDAGIYALSLDYEGKTYPVKGHFDVRAAMSFLLEGCFELDAKSQTALLQSECSSGLYAETQVVSLGPHRYFRTPEDLAAEEIVQGTEELAIMHDALDCIVNDYFPQVSAELQPTQLVQSGRVYFRAIQYPDFYYVDLVATGTGYQATLPKPSQTTNQLVYYIEGVDKEYNPVRSPEYTVDVMDSGTCKRRYPAAAYYMGADPSIAVGATVPGAASVPPGFLSAGIGSYISSTGTVSYAVAGTAAAAGGGLGTKGLVIILGAAAGATALYFLLRSTNEEEASPIAVVQ